MTDVDKQFVRSLVNHLAADVEARSQHGTVDETVVFYHVLEDRNVIPAFRDQDFSKDMVQTMSEEWSVSRNDGEVRALKEMMEKHGVTDGQVQGHAASALSRLRRLTLANT